MSAWILVGRDKKLNLAGGGEGAVLEPVGKRGICKGQGQREKPG